jgi:aspartate-semialdehyde dehydrogenase
MPKIRIVDPLTLLGREALQLLAGDPFLASDLSYHHTADDDEHQIAELAGQPALVPPIDDADDLAGADAVLVASDQPTSRLEHVKRFAESHPDTPIVVMGQLPGWWEELPPAAGADPDRAEVHLRVAHPALVALWTLVSALDQLEPTRVVVAALEPVSAGGTDDVERLARQAALRLQGAAVEELIDDRVLAFNLVAADDGDLNRDAALLLPKLEVAATRMATGCFHGHAANIGISFRSGVEQHEVLEALREDERFADPDLPLSLDACVESGLIALSIPRLSGDGTLLAVTAMVDGLRVGGAATALQILRSLL